MKLGPNGQPFRTPVVTPSGELPDQAMDFYWHPDRDGVEAAPDEFMRDLRMVDHYDRVRVVRPPEGAPLVYPRAYLVWYRKPSVLHYLSPGWLLLRDWRDSKGEPLPLDGRVFSYLYSVSAEAFGGGRRYFEHCVEEMNRDKAKKEKVHRQGNHDRVEDYRQFTQVKNIGSGNKFSLHHDGTVIPSRGQANWLAERKQRMQPGEVTAGQRREREARAS